MTSNSEKQMETIHAHQGTRVDRALLIEGDDNLLIWVFYISSSAESGTMTE